MSSNLRRQDASTRRDTGLRRLQPIDAAPFRQPSNLGFIWFTILLAWLLSLLPWRLWESAPDILLLVITFWTLNEPRRVSLLTAFVFGLLMDVHDATLLGEQALTYLIAAYGALLMARRLQHFNPVIQAVHMLPLFMLADGVSRLLHAWLVGGWAGWGWAWSALLTALLWPLADFLLHLPQRRMDDVDSGAV